MLGLQWIRVVVLHSKSKYVRGGQHLWRDVVSGGREEFIRRAVVNRRRISAEAMRVREYLDDLLCKNYGNHMRAFMPRVLLRSLTCLAMGVHMHVFARS